MSIIFWLLFLFHLVVATIKFYHLQIKVSSVQTEEFDVNKQLLEKYSSTKLFTLNEDFNGSQLLDLQLSRGSLVGVMKEGDPMGNKHRYYVDTGSMMPCLYFYISFYLSINRRRF